MFWHNLQPRLAWAGIVLTAVFGWAELAQAQVPLTVLGVSDRNTYNLVAWFAVPTTNGFTYRVLLDGQPVPTDLTNWVTTVDYHELSVTRTNVSTGAVTNLLIRFIVQSERGNPEKGLIRWTPYPPIPSTASEAAGARLRIIVPATYPLGLPIPVVVWVEDESGRPRRINGLMTAPGFEANPIQVFRGVGSGMLPPAFAAGPLIYAANLAGLQTNKVIQIESTTSWTPRSGVLAASEAWPENSRIHLTAGLTVPAGVTLTIGAGTVVKLNPLVNLTNFGRIVIAGTPDRPVIFTATNIVWPEKPAGAWGGLVMRSDGVTRPQLEVNGAIFTGGAGATSWSFPSPSTSHRSEQPVLLLSNAVARLTNAAIIHTAGQVGNGCNSDLTLDHTLCQRAITCGEYVGGTILINESALIEFPNDDGVVDAAIADADYDGIYFTTGTHILMNSLFGFAKDDAIDSGSGSAGTVWVSNCWVESALHEALAWSGGGRLTWTYDSVLINSGQGIEAGWTEGSTDGSPNCFAERLLTTANSVGARFGDNYDWTYLGRLRLTNSLILYNYRDVFLKTWNNPGSGWQSNSWVDRLGQTDLRSNYLTAADARFPSNRVWNPAADGWRLAHFMTTPAGAPVGIGWAVRTNQFPMTNLLEGVPVRLSSFTTNFVRVTCRFETDTGQLLASAPVEFAPGQTLNRVWPSGFDARQYSQIRAVLTDPVHGEVTGLGTVTFAGSLPPVQVSLAVLTNLLPGYRLAEGTFVTLSSPATVPVSLDYVYEAAGQPLQAGTLVFAPLETRKQLFLTSVAPAGYPLIRLTVSHPTNATLVGLTTIAFTNPPLVMYLATGAEQLPLGQFASGVPVAVTGPAPPGTSVGFSIEGNHGQATNGLLVFAPGETYGLILAPTINPAAHDLIRVRFSNPTGVPWGGPTEVWYVRVGTAPTPLLVASNSAWRYLDTGGDAGTAWRYPAYDDSSWSNGVAQLGFGDGDERTVIRRVGTNGQNTITFYFRQRFVVENPALFTNLLLWLLRDDGGVVYLNGTEVYRSPSMPAPPTVITYQTLANAQGSSAPPDNTVDQANISPAFLVPGTNLVAVEIHQHRADSSDVSFDFALTGQPTPQPPPQLYFGGFGGQFAIAWSNPGYVLEHATNLARPQWTVVTNRSPFVIVPTEPQEFFRLRRN